MSPSGTQGHDLSGNAKQITALSLFLVKYSEDRVFHVRTRFSGTWCYEV
jgi:hypothetical protein